jgi:lysozyme
MAAGVLRGAYHFFHASDNPTQQAQFYLKTIGTLADNDLPPMLDWEINDGQSAATNIANAKIWLQLVQAATGKVPVIYTGPSFWNSLGNPQGFEQYPLFIAHYDVSCPDVPPPWSNWTFWQTGLGPQAGVSNDADLDVFNGSPAELLNFALTGAH